MVIRQIFISPSHNFFGHHGRPPDTHPTQEVEQVECVAGRGLRGDRYFDYKNNYKGQVTFFSREIFDGLRAAFPSVDKNVSVLRRNLIVSDVDLNALIGHEFELQGVQFLGTAHCAPCYWLDQAFAPGTEKWLKNNGGLRAKILSDGWLKADALALS